MHIHSIKIDTNDNIRHYNVVLIYITVNIKNRNLYVYNVKICCFFDV